MGKIGKARKRQRVQNEVYNTNDSSSSSIHDDTAEVKKPRDSVDVKTFTISSLSLDLATAIDALNAFSRRLDIYQKKTSKALRIALYPLIEIQRGKHFEPTIPQPFLSDEEFNQIANSQNIQVTVEVINYFITNKETLKEPEFKPFRKALHPFVLFHAKKEKNPSIIDETLNQVSNPVSNPISTNIVDAAELFHDENTDSFSNQIYYSFRKKDWRACLVAIVNLSKCETEMPKLGSLQRWVRSCDLSSEAFDQYGHSPDKPPSPSPSHEIQKYSLLLLDALLRMMQIKYNRQQHSHEFNHFMSTMSNKTPTFLDYSSIDKIDPTIIKYPLFSVNADISVFPFLNESTDAYKGLLEGFLITQLDSMQLSVLSENFVEKFVLVVSHVPGPQRRPPSPHDLNIFMTKPCTINLSSSCLNKTKNSIINIKEKEAESVQPYPQRHDIPSVPGAFLITDVLSPVECAQLMLAAEKIGYTPDAVDGIDNVVWLADDDSLVMPIFNRVRELLPSSIEGCQLAGINARWRLFRYFPGAVYRPHIDGAWPGSGLSKTDGTFTDDLFGDRRSRLTFLMYLNSGFEGGATTFFVPNDTDMSNENIGYEGKEVVDNSKSCVGKIAARGVLPQQGAVLCFPHGSALNSLVHEGSAVIKGAKYVIRTDVLYYNKLSNT